VTDGGGFGNLSARVNWSSETTKTNGGSVRSADQQDFKTWPFGLIRLAARVRQARLFLSPKRCLYRVLGAAVDDSAVCLQNHGLGNQAGG